MKRFLRYSLEKQKKIRAVMMVNGGISQVNLCVVALDEQSVTFLTPKGKQPLTLPLSDILSADYARGDKGEI